MRAIEDGPRGLSNMRDTEPRPMVSSYAVATKGACVVHAYLGGINSSWHAVRQAGE